MVRDEGHELEQGGATAGEGHDEVDESVGRLAGGAEEGGEDLGEDDAEIGLKVAADVLVDEGELHHELGVVTVLLYHLVQLVYYRLDDRSQQKGVFLSDEAEHLDDELNTGLGLQQIRNYFSHVVADVALVPQYEQTIEDLFV